MSDDEDKLAALPEKVPLSELVRFFDAHFPNFKCVMCGHVEFRVQSGGLEDDDIGVLGSRYTLMVGGKSRNFKYPVIVVACARCGHLYNLMAKNAVNWLAKNPVSK